jgi:hypothetical protein
LHSKQRQCPRRESNLVFDLRRVACEIRHTPRTDFHVGLVGNLSYERPAEELNPVWQIRSLPCYPAHSQGVSAKLSAVSYQQSAKTI